MPLHGSAEADQHEFQRFAREVDQWVERRDAGGRRAFVYWHAHLPERHFNWFVDGDFVDVLGVVASTFVVPLLAVPQATHYVLDGMIWRRREKGFVLD